MRMLVELMECDDAGCGDDGCGVKLNLNPELLLWIVGKLTCAPRELQEEASRGQGWVLANADLANPFPCCRHLTCRATLGPLRDSIKVPHLHHLHHLHHLQYILSKYLFRFFDSLLEVGYRISTLPLAQPQTPSAECRTPPLLKYNCNRH
jgi:hypothetical protein